MNELQFAEIYHPSGGMNIDSNGISMQPNEAVDAVNVVITAQDVRMRYGTELFGEADYTQPEEPILEYAEYNDPVVGTLLMAFCSERIYRLDPGVGWTEVTGYDGEAGGLLEGLGINMWSICSVLDDDLGATIVAAGSVYNRPSDTITGGEDRVLLYYDSAEGAEIFKVLEWVSVYPISEEETGEFGPTGAAVVTGIPGVADSTHTNYNSDLKGIEPASFVVRDSVNGVFAISGAAVYSLPVGPRGASVDCYRLIPSDGTRILYGDNSWVRVDGTAWSLQFLDDSYAGAPILLDYDYTYEVAYNPVFVKFFHNALLMFSTYEEDTYFPWRMRHSVQGNIRKTNTSYFQDIVVSDVAAITQVSVVETAYYNTIDSYLYVFTRNGIQRGLYNSSYGLSSEGTFAPFITFQKAYSEGLEAYRTLLTINGMQIYLGNNDVYAFDGTSRTSLTLNKNTGDSRIREYLLDNLRITDLKKCFAVYDEFNKRYMLFIQTNSNIESYPVDCLVFDIERGSWTRYVYPGTSAAICTFALANNTIANLKGNIKSLVGIIEDLTGYENRKIILAYSTAGESSYSFTPSGIYYDAYGTEDVVDYTGPIPIALNSYFITRDFMGNTLANQDRWEEVFLEAKDGTLTIKHNTEYSIDPAEFSSGSVREIGIRKRKYYHPDETSNAIRFCISLTDGCRFRWLQPMFMEQEMTNL